MTFEEWWVERHGINWLAKETISTRDEARAAWNEAAKAEREACAKVCEYVASVLSDEAEENEKKRVAMLMCLWLAREIRSAE